MREYGFSVTRILPDTREYGSLETGTLANFFAAYLSIDIYRHHYYSIIFTCLLMFSLHWKRKGRNSHCIRSIPTYG